MSVSYEYYKIFYHVATCKSINKAASVLFNSQPNITRAINNLEKELDCKLFIRSHKGVELTEEGKELYQHVSVAQHQIELAENLLTSIHDFKSGSITIALSIDVPEVYIRDIMFPLIESFHNSYPEIHLQTILGHTSNLISDITNNLYDLALISTDNRYDNKSDVLILAETHDLAVAGVKYRELMDRPVKLAELAEYPLVTLWSQTDSYSLYRRFFDKNGLVFSPQTELSSLMLIKQYVECNFGIAFLSPKTVEDSIKANKLFKIDLVEETPGRFIKLLTSEKGLRNRAAMRLHEEFESLIC